MCLRLPQQERGGRQRGDGDNDKGACGPSECADGGRQLDIAEAEAVGAAHCVITLAHRKQQAAADRRTDELNGPSRGEWSERGKPQQRQYEWIRD